MGTFSLDKTSEPGILRITLAGKFTVAEMTAFVAEHNRQVDAFGVGDYRVWADLTDLAPLSPECADILERAKRYSSIRPNFQGSAVLVSAPTVALQTRRTSAGAGVQSTELMSSDPEELREHLKKVHRSGGR